MKEIYELSQYIYGAYPKIKDMFPFWQILSLIDKNEDKVICVKDNGKFMGAAMYLKLIDETMEKLCMGLINLSDPIDVKIALREKGDNLHFIYIVANSMKTVLKGLKQVIKKEQPHSVSWFKPDTSLHFVKLRGELCQSQ